MYTVIKHVLASLAGLMLALAAAGTARAQEEPVDAYPSKPIRFLVPIAAGGGTDILGRALANEMQKDLPNGTFVENRPGANGTVGSQVASRTKPDGYTILVGSIGTHAANQYLYEKLPYDPAKDFEPVTLLAQYNNVVIVRADSPFKTMKDLIEYARQNPGKLNYGITAIGSSSHLAVEKFKHDAAIDLTGVPYNGANPATVDLLGGRIDLMFDVVVSQFPNIQAGKVRALATTAAKRSPVLPDVPAIAELGYPGFEAVGWVGLFVPAGTPKPIVEKIAAMVRKAYKSPDIQQKLGSRGLDLVSNTPEEFARFVTQERAKWSKVIQVAQIKVN